MTLLVSPRLLQVPADPDVLSEEDLAVVLKPVQNLLDVLLEEPEGEPLVELDLLAVPLGLQAAVTGQDVVDNGQDVAGALGVVGRGILGRLRRVAVLERAIRKGGQRPGSRFEFSPVGEFRENNVQEIETVLRSTLLRFRYLQKSCSFPKVEHARRYIKNVRDDRLVTIDHEQFSISSFLSDIVVIHGALSVLKKSYGILRLTFLLFGHPRICRKGKLRTH